MTSEQKIAELEEKVLTLSTHIAGMADRFNAEMRPHLRNAWMRGHNSGFWNGRASATRLSAAAVDGLSEAEKFGLEHGLAECPYIETTEELAAIAAEFGVSLDHTE